MNKVLIADDEAHVVRILQRTLERAGFQVESCPNGEAALARLREEPPDVLISDVQMPRMGGRELCQRIQAEWPDRRFPIVVITSRPEYEERAWSHDIDNLYFMEKPISPRRLVALLERHVSQSAAH